MIRIGLRMLVGDRAKYAGVLFGIAVTTFLTTLVVAMFAGMLTRTFALINDTPEAEIWVMDPACRTVTQTINLPGTAIDRVRGVTGVQQASRLALGSGTARLPHGLFEQVDIVGVDDSTMLGLPRDASGPSAELLRRPDAVLVSDAHTRSKLRAPRDRDDGWTGRGPVESVRLRPVEPGDELLINSTIARVTGRAVGRARFTPQPVLYATYSTSARLLPPERHRLTFVLVQVSDGQDAAQVARRIEAGTGLRARTAAEFRADTVWWFLRNSDFIGHVGVMVSFASAVGLAITGLMLYMFTKENARQYAALKAMGASGSRMIAMVFAQGGLAGSVGFGLGLGLCVLIGTSLATTGFPFRIMWYTPLGVGVMVVLVTLASSAVSARAALRLEPAMVFKT